jgi:ketosteroid isomerase-like protein
MENVPNSKLGNFYREHINFILQKDIASLLNQYTDDCLLISSFMKEPRYYHGKTQLNEHMQGILGIEGLETKIRFWAETENTLMVTEDITLQAGGQTAKMIFADSWVLRDGKIAIHFAGMVQHPDGSLS